MLLLCPEMEYRRLGGESNREIVSFRSCVRCEAACAGEAMMFLSLGFPTANSGPWAVGVGVPFVCVKANVRQMWFYELTKHLWCLLHGSGDSWWILASFCYIFVGFGESLVLLFTGAVGRGKRCSPVPSEVGG